MKTNIIKIIIIIGVSKRGFNEYGPIVIKKNSQESCERNLKRSYFFQQFSSL